MIRQRAWRTTEEAHLRLTYPHEPTQSIAAELGRSPQSVYRKAREMRIRKSAAYMAQLPPNAKEKTA